MVFAASCLFTLSTVVAVHFIQQQDAYNRRIGIVRDDALRKRMENQLEQDRQDALYRQLSSEQQVSK